MYIQNHRSVRLLIALAATLAIATTVQAQASSPARKGFFISASAAYGSADVSGSGFPLPSDLQSGLAGYFTLGGTFSPQWRLGAQFDAYSKSSQGISMVILFYGASVTFYPSLNNNLWLKGNLGGMSLGFDDPNGLGTITQSGFAGGLGIGYDWLPGHGKFAVIPYASYTTEFSGASFDAYPGLPVKVSLFQIGVGIGYKH